MPRSKSTLHPFTVLCLGVAVISLTTAAGYWPLGCAVIAVCLVLAARRGRLGRMAALSAALVVPTLGSQLVIHGLVAPSGSPALFAAGPVRIRLGCSSHAFASAVRC